MDLFEEISKAKQELPKVNKITKEVKKYPLNFYQLVALVIFAIMFCVGIVLGNLFATCEASSYFYSDTCLVTEFNFSLMVLIWFVGGILSVFLFAIGHIITLLYQINEKLIKFRS